MALRKILSEKEKENLIESHSLREDIIRWYTLAESDIIIIAQNCRGTANKLGFAIQLCYLRFPVGNPFLLSTSLGIICAIVEFNMKKNNE